MSRGISDRTLSERALGTEPIISVLPLTFTIRAFASFSSPRLETEFGGMVIYGFRAVEMWDNILGWRGLAFELGNTGHLLTD